MVANAKTVGSVDLSQAVLRELEQTPQVDVREISVATENGVVTLEGRVRSRSAKKAAEQAAVQVSGVKAIASELDIKPVPERHDTDIAKDILRAFQSHIIMNVDDVRVIVSGGRVRLEGLVHSHLERLVAEAAARGVRGLRDIQNDLKVGVPGVSVSGHGEMTAARFGEEEVSNNEPWIETGAAEAG